MDLKGYLLGGTNGTMEMEVFFGWLGGAINQLRQNLHLFPPFRRPQT